MYDLLLDLSTHDLVIKNGDLQPVSDDAAIRQNIKQRLQHYIAEWFLDTSLGVPYYQFILVKNPNLDLVNATLQNVVVSTPGVLELTGWQLDFNSTDRTLTIQLEARSANTSIGLTTSVGASIG
jgi:hypothetical protein